MSSNLQRAIEFVWGKETGEVTDYPDDPGKLTKWGIALAEHPELTRDDILNMTQERAAEIYVKSYWPSRAEELPGYLSTPLLATCVLQGRETGVEILQTSLGVHPDGDIGPQTVLAARKADAPKLLARFLSEQVRHFRQDSEWATDGIGWVERSAEALLQTADFQL